MTKFTINVGLDYVTGSDLSKGKAAFPHLAYAVQAVAQAAQARWVAYARGEPLPDGSQIGIRTGQYARSIKMMPEGDFEARVFTDSPYADAIENGMPARDLKKMLGTSTKTRRAKDGTRYLIIPFRWGTPSTVGFGANNTMPTPAEGMAHIGAGLKPSRITGMTTRVSASGHLIPQRVYRWGGRLNTEAIQKAGITGDKARNMRGMVKMQGSRGGSKDTQYLTFRVMTEKSTGWKTKPTEGKRPAYHIWREFEAKAKRAFDAAVKQDLKAQSPL
ncbi:MAG: hypothetical protein EOM22_14900 [Gammaproteobacteria bacterium]|nr:hypothetical protein [Gammaproteobacteria bacterium]